MFAKKKPKTKPQKHVSTEDDAKRFLVVADILEAIAPHIPDEATRADILSAARSSKFRAMGILSGIERRQNAPKTKPSVEEPPKTKPSVEELLTDEKFKYASLKTIKWALKEKYGINVTEQRIHQIKKEFLSKK